MGCSSGKAAPSAPVRAELQGKTLLESQAVVSEGGGGKAEERPAAAPQGLEPAAAEIEDSSAAEAEGASRVAASPISPRAVPVLCKRLTVIEEELTAERTGDDSDKSPAEPPEKQDEQQAAADADVSVQAEPTVATVATVETEAEIGELPGATDLPCVAASLPDTEVTDGEVTLQETTDSSVKVTTLQPETAQRGGMWTCFALC
eukprot:TRINITY_DN12012_c0_g1_i1.p1 TRINITY_DN12012_c0_g1~~TRINITY_DN12012_c0_g1_i1.p1  ORF type:complete len:204 (-),score=72.39 TRINITY_DN12012_c0_g1_i1:334-945(-)